MARKLRTPTRTISNKGQPNRYSGWFPSPKARYPKSEIAQAYDSISALKASIYLEWRKDVVEMEFEAEKLKIHPPGHRSFYVIPDFRVILDSGVIAYVESKYSREKLKQKQARRLDMVKEYLESKGFPYVVIFRSELEENGFIDTIALLRRYAFLSFPAQAVDRATAALAKAGPQNLRQYRWCARQQGVRISLLYHLLYHQKLELLYEPLADEVLLCPA